MNESGVLKNYCSLDVHDSEFSALGTWHSVEMELEGAGGNPPFDPVFISNMLNALEMGVRRETPYCRCVLLPLEKRYGVVEHTKTVSSEGIMLVSLERGALPFRSQNHIYSVQAAKPKSYSYQKLGLFIWRNRQYLLKNRVPRDVEIAYMKWTCRDLLDPFKAHLDFRSLKGHFQMNLGKKRQQLICFN